MVAGSQDGMQFDVWIASNIAQAARHNWAWNPSFQDIAYQSAVLTERFNGCEMCWITGDASVQTIGLAYNGTPMAPTPRRKIVFTCDSHEYRNGPDAMVLQS